MSRVRTPLQCHGLGRGDLLRLMFQAGMAAERAATMTGFERSEPASRAAPQRDVDSGHQGEAIAEPPISGDEPGSLQPAVWLWRAIGPRLFEGAEQGNIPPRPAFLDQVRAASDRDLAATSARTPIPAPLLPRARLGPVLRSLLMRLQPSAHIDERRLVSCLARCKPLSNVIRRRRSAWVPRVQVYLDDSAPMQPCWDDQLSVVAWIRRIRGEAGLSQVLVDGQGPDVEIVSGRRRSPRAPSAGSRVLALSDLGCISANEAAQHGWAQRARDALRRGAEPIALAPCPATRLSASARRYWSAIAWEDARPVTLRTGAGIEAMRSRIRPALPAPVAAQRAQRLLCLLAPAVRIEPSLLRAARRLLPRHEADLGTELDVWLHECVVSRTPFAITLDPDKARALRDEFQTLEAARKRQVLALLEQLHAHRSPVILDEERQHTGLPEAMARAQQGQRRYAKRLLERSTGSPTERTYLRHWQARQRPVDFRRDAVVATWALGHRRADGTGFDRPLPEGLSLRDVAWALHAADPRLWSIVQHGEHLACVLAGKAQPGLPIAVLPARSPQLQGRVSVASEPRVRSQAVDLASSGSTRFVLPEGSVEIELDSDLGALRLVHAELPTWASALERDGEGLHVYARLPRVADEQRVPWPSWADTLEFDAFGVWTQLALGKQASVRMRYIPAGSFMMGSPGDELGRWAGELAHEVVLSRGFWLADTPCTQAQWQAVMGDNPSHFTGEEDRPVEQVSWEDCQQFCARLNDQVVGLGARLPTEAQWEYACRAATVSAYNDGSACTNPQGEDPALNRLGWYDANSGNTTHPVKQLGPNAWGLFDMHGNVWEWCADWSGDYDAGAQTDPCGPEKGHNRVVRGGSWAYQARLCRAAVRNCSVPGFHGESLGFRLAAGQLVSAAEPRGGAELRAGRPGGEAGRRPARRARRKGRGQ